MQGTIVNKPCTAKLIRFIPNNLEEYPFVALVCIGQHTHPPPPPERTPTGIKDNLQTMITNAINNDDVVTTGSIVQGIVKIY